MVYAVDLDISHLDIGNRPKECVRARFLGQLGTSNYIGDMVVLVNGNGPYREPRDRWHYGPGKKEVVALVLSRKESFRMNKNILTNEGLASPRGAHRHKPIKNDSLKTKELKL